MVWLKLYDKHFVDSYQIDKWLNKRMKELSIDDIGIWLFMSLCSCFITKLYHTCHYLKLNIMYSLTYLNQIKMRKWNRYLPNLCQLNISSGLFVNGTCVYPFVHDYSWCKLLFTSQPNVYICYRLFINISFVCSHWLVKGNLYATMGSPKSMS